MKSLIFSFAIVTFILSNINAQKPIGSSKENPITSSPRPIFIDEVKKVGNEIVIPYKRYKLTNGLTILIHEDHSDPICYVDVTYHIGSAREQQGRSGFAHFFEHMMFQGSKHVADDQHFKIVTEAGGILNGTTNNDRTNYFETVPSNQLEKMLWLEADRMGFLLDSVTQKKFEIQRATVKNERGQNYDNRPYGVTNEKIGEALYPKGHPYSWSTIGYLVDLDRVDVDDLKRFYLRWYGPNNAVLTIAGDVNTEEVLTLVQKYFGSISVGKEVKPQTVSPVILTENRYLSYEDNVKFPQLSVVYPGAKLNTKEDAALDVLADILSGNQGSPLYKAFIESKKAVGAQSFHFSRELAGQFHIVVRANSGGSLSELETLLKTTLEDWEKVGVTDDDLIKYKANYKTELLNALGTIQGKGSALASYFTLCGDANFIKKDINNYLSLTKEDIMNAYNTYIKNKFSVVLSCVPKGKTDLTAKADNWKMYERTVETESDEYKNLSYIAPKDNFDRSKMPISKPAKPVPVPNFYVTRVNKTIPLIGVTETELPKVNISINFKVGHRFEPLAKSGVANLLATMLNQSTLKTKAEEVENKLDRLGSTLNINTSNENISVFIESTKDNLTATLKIVEESLFEPKFDNEEFEIEKKKVLDDITSQLSNATAIADITFRKLLYGAGHILSLPVIGTNETVNSITIDDVKNYYKNLNSLNTSISVTGDITENQIVKELAFLSKLKSEVVAKLSEPEIPKIEKTKLYFIDKKGAAQSEIKIGYIALPYDALGEFHKATIMNYSFGTGLNSRLNYLLRELKGWTYSVRCEFSGGKQSGTYSISGGFKSNTTDSTLVEILKELKKYAELGITDEELSFTKNAMAQSDALKYESAEQKLRFISRVLEYNLPKDYFAKQTEILNTITKQEVNALAKKYLPYNNMVIVVVGDKATNLEKVKKLGLEVIEVDVTAK
jgi:zinc protease